MLDIRLCRTAWLAALGLATGGLPAALSGQQVARLDPARLEVMRDSLIVRAGGNDLGWWRFSLTPMDGGWRYDDRTTLTMGVDQSTTIELDREGRIRSVRQRGVMGGDSLRTDATWDAGRAIGAAQVPGPTPGGPFDLAVTDATLDDNFVAAAVPMLDWADGASWTLEVLSSGQGEVVTYELAVERADSVEIDGTVIPAWVGTMTGTPLPITYWVTRDAPRRLLRIVPVGSPLVFERVGG